MKLQITQKPNETFVAFLIRRQRIFDNYEEAEQNKKKRVEEKRKRIEKTSRALKNYQKQQNVSKSKHTRKMNQIDSDSNLSLQEKHRLKNLYRRHPELI